MRGKSMDAVSAGSGMTATGRQRPIHGHLDEGQLSWFARSRVDHPESVGFSGMRSPNRSNALRPLLTTAVIRYDCSEPPEMSHDPAFQQGGADHRSTARIHLRRGTARAEALGGAGRCDAAALFDPAAAHAPRRARPHHCAAFARSSAWLRSARMSSICSRPIERRT